MKRLTVLFGTDNSRLIDVLDEMADLPEKPTSREFPENGAAFGPRTQKDRLSVAYGLVDQSKYRPMVVCTQDDIIFTTIRVAIHQNRISADDVEFRWYNGNDEPLILQVNQDGRLNNWPAGFFDVMEQLLSILLGPKPIG